MEGTTEVAVQDVLDLALSDPKRAASRAEILLADESLEAVDRIRALWARGLAQRELGHLGAARADLERAIAQAQQCDDLLTTEVAMTLASVLLLQGDTAGALEALESAPPVEDRRVRARFEMQRGLMLHRTGALDRAAPAYDAAIELAHSVEDRIGEGRTRINAGLLHILRGDYRAAEHHLEVARHLTSSMQQHVAAGVVEHNFGYLRMCQGDLVGALAAFAAADHAFRTSQSRSHLGLLLADHAAAAIEANLLDEAISLSSEALQIATEDGNHADMAEIGLVAARARLAADDHGSAHEAARTACRAFENSGRDDWVPFARLVEAQAAFADGLVESGFADEVARTAEQLGLLGWAGEAVDARVLAVRAALASGDSAGARRHLDLVDSKGSSMPVSRRVAIDVARAVIAEAEDDPSAVRRAVRAGLRRVAANHATLGAIELRAHALENANVLAQIGARLALRQRRGRELLWYIEFARAMSALIPRADPPTDPVISRSLEELRAVTLKLRETRSGDAAKQLRRRIVQLESTVRSTSRHVRASGSTFHFETADVISSLGKNRTLVEYGLLDGGLVAAVVRNGRTSVVELGHDGSEALVLESLVFSLTRLSRSNISEASRAAAMSATNEAASELDRILLPASISSEDHPLVIVPTGRLHGVPWRCLPSLRRRVVTVAPSLAGWGFAQGARRGKPARVALIAGPDLDAAENELDRLLLCHSAAQRLSGSDAAVAEVLTVLQHVDVAHFACHGSFRRDNPLFSSLRLVDGDLNVYDLQRCTSLPELIVLSACDTAQNAALRGGGLLGIADALIQLGVSSVIAPLTPVNDARSVDLMVRLHTHLAAGVPAAEALARASIGPDGELDPTAAPFICFGS